MEKSTMEIARELLKQEERKSHPNLVITAIYKALLEAEDVIKSVSDDSALVAVAKARAFLAKHSGRED